MNTFRVWREVVNLFTELVANRVDIGLQICSDLL
jgi:hypothetical protein